MQLSLLFLLCIILIFHVYCFSSVFETIIHSICHDGELENGYSQIKSIILEFEEKENDENTTSSLSFSTVQYVKLYHTLSELELILFSHFQESLLYHRKGKNLSSSNLNPSEMKVIPPLPELHLSGISCGGVGDLYYVSAVIIKSMIDRDTVETTGKPAESVKQSKHLKGDLESLMTLITLTSDSGLTQASERHLSHAFQLLSLSVESDSLLTKKERDDYIALLTFRAALLTPAVFSSKEELFLSRKTIQQRISSLSSSAEKGGLTIGSLDEFVLSPTFYLVYYGFNDRKLLQQLHKSYQLAYPSLISGRELLPALSLSKRQLNQIQGQEQPLQHHSFDDISTLETFTVSSVSSPKELAKGNEGAAAEPLKMRRRARIGFVSSYFRRHSICKLFCSIILHLSQLDDKYEIFLFSTLQENHHDSYTKKLIQRSSSSSTFVPSSFHFISVGKPLVNNRDRILSHQIDILVYLDIGMEPSTVVWASSRLAPIQMVLWGHPSTTGLDSIDYYISSQFYHQYSPISVAVRTPHTEEQKHFRLTPFLDDDHIKDSDDLLSFYPQSFFSEQLIQLQNLNFHFWKPSLSLDLKRIFNNHFIKERKEQDQDQEQERLQEKKKFKLKKLEKVEMRDNNEEDGAIKQLLIKREKCYYQMIIRYLKEENKKQFSKGKQQLIELLSVKLKGTARSVAIDSAFRDIQPNNMTTGIAAENEKEKVFYILCPQYLPKFHPNFDKILLSLIWLNYPGLSGFSNSTRFASLGENGDGLKRGDKFKIRLILLNNSEKRLIWQKTLIQRWTNVLSSSYLTGLSPFLRNATSFETIASAMINESIVWMPSLSSEEYLLLLGIGDLMIDPFPFGGGVTTLESFFMCTPVLTLPDEQNVPQLAAGMITTLIDQATIVQRMSEQEKLDFQRLVVVHSQQDYLGNIQELLLTNGEGDNEKLQFLRKSICENHDIFYRNIEDDELTDREGTEKPFHQESIEEWNEMFQNLIRGSF
jgi:hypothetical protein